MAKLTKDQTLALARIFVRAQNILKGRALDQARACLASDRQFDQFKKTIKDGEFGLRQGFMEALVQAGLTDDPVAPSEMAGLK